MIKFAPTIKQSKSIFIANAFKIGGQVWMVETEFESQRKLDVLQVFGIMFDTWLFWMKAVIKKNADMNYAN